MAVFFFPVSRTVVPRPTADQVRPGTYLTDRSRLLFVVSQLAPDGELEAAILEDCKTLNVRPYSVDELQALDLEPVRTASHSPTAAAAAAAAAALR